MKPLLLIFSGFILSCFVFTTTSCDKNTECKATVRTLDETGVPLASTNVSLFATVKTSNGGTVVADVKATGVSDEAGEVRFTFKLPGIYDIRATNVVGSNTLVGTGIIKLEEGKGVEKSVTVK